VTTVWSLVPCTTSLPAAVRPTASELRRDDRDAGSRIENEVIGTLAVDRGTDDEDPSEVVDPNRCRLRRRDDRCNR
jgi:hypothetical protein